MPKFIRNALALGAGMLTYDVISIVYSRLNHTTAPIHWWRAVGLTIIAVPIFWLINKGKESKTAHRDLASAASSPGPNDR